MPTTRTRTTLPADLDIDAELAAMQASEAALSFTPGTDLAVAVAEASSAAAELAERAGVVYLLHFDRRYQHAGHYCGWSENLCSRLADHAAGRGARLLTVLRDAGIGWQLARTWPGGRGRERALKRQGGASRRCPLCGIHPRTVRVGRPA